MRRLTTLDAMNLALEDERTTLHVGALAILDGQRSDGSALTRDDIVELVRERLHMLPPMRWTLAEVPFGIGHPSWVDGEVDLDYHIRELALPPPGGDSALEAQVARLAAHPMDRSRPLWELYLIHGLAGGRVAVLTKMHHAAVDGVSGAEVMSVLFDTSPGGRVLPPAPPHHPERRPGQAALLARGIGAAAKQSVSGAVGAGRAVQNLDKNPFLSAAPGGERLGKALTRVKGREAPELMAEAPGTAPRTKFNGRVSKRRSFCMVPLPLEPVRAIKNAQKATVNDVIVAMCAGALRSWLDANGELPDAPLIAWIPVSVRSEEGFGGNAVGAMTVALPTDEADPLARLLRCRDGLRGAKERFHAVPATMLTDAADVIPPALLAQATRTLTRLAASPAMIPLANVVISNVPGPRKPLYCAGHQVRAIYPVSSVGDSLGLNITVFSYGDELNFGLLADATLVPDLPALGEALRAELDLLHTITRPKESFR